jgi:hypothetical protein
MKRMPTRTSLTIAALALLPATSLCAPQGTRADQAGSRQKEELACKTEEPSDPMQDIAAWAKMDEAQRKRLDALFTVVSSVRSRRPASQRAEVLSETLLANAGSATRNETALVGKVADALARVLPRVRLDEKSRRRLARDLWAVVNVERTQSVASSAVASIINHLRNNGARGADTTALADSLNAILKNQFSKDWGRKVQ